LKCWQYAFTASAKLSPHTGDLNPIKSVRGRGYQLCVDLEIQ